MNKLSWSNELVYLRPTNKRSQSEQTNKIFRRRRLSAWLLQMIECILHLDQQFLHRK